MESIRHSRFKRATTVSPIQLTDRDRDIIRLVYRHRFLRSQQIIALLGGSPQPVLRRLNLLYHHGYLERPRAQLQYYERGGSQSIVYGLGNKGGDVLRLLGTVVNSSSWDEKNHVIGRVYLEHALFVAEVMVSLELACRKHGGVRLFYEDQLELPVEKRPFRWRVKGRLNLGVIPDRVFALEHADKNGHKQRIHFFLEADRGTMPVKRRTLAQTSFYRKLLAYEATWTQKIHQRQFDIHRFRVLTVTTSAERVRSMIDACSQLGRGHGLFLFTDRAAIFGDPLAMAWQTGRLGKTGRLLD